MNVEPAQKPGRSKQDYGTPTAFVDAVTARFGPLVHDLAASAENAKAATWSDERLNALVQPWAKMFRTGNLWLNPPYGDLYPWTEKCRLESKKRQGFILLLVPASIGATWFVDNVKKHAMVLALTPRLTFEGCTTPYPKDCLLAVFGYGFRGFDCWNWKQTAPNGGAARDE